tara:strand:- start:216 stop:422 length:207 start_codon:yes stop_codon:yes gene_type:complete
MAKKEHSVELLRLLEILKTNNPTQLQHKKFKELNQEEREIYMAALKKKGQTDRKLLNKLNTKIRYRKG